MEKENLYLSADKQTLTTEALTLASETVKYVEAHFTLGDNWDFDTISAIWKNGNTKIATVLDNEGKCYVPTEVLAVVGFVSVNLAGSNIENDEVEERLTTYPVTAIIVDKTAYTSGTETVPVTPSQFEQFIAQVAEEVAKIKDIDRVELNPDYTLTFYFSDGTSSTTTSIRGEKGETGNGIASITKVGTSGLVDTYRITYTDGNTHDYTVTNGAKGDTGNGIATIAKTSTSGLVDTYTITYTNGTTSTFTVTNGAKGDTGNGIASVAKTSTSGLVDTYTITFTDGTTTTFDVTNGQNGEVTYDDLALLMPQDSASGAIASFPDGCSVFTADNVTITIEPVQSGSGDPSPDNVRPISGWTGANVCVDGKNLLPPKFYSGLSYNASAGTQFNPSDITSTVTVDGNTFKKSVGSWQGMGMISDLLKSGTYRLKAQLASTNMRYTSYILDTDFKVVSQIGLQNGGTSITTNSTVTLNSDGYIAMQLASSASGEVSFTEPQIELGSTATDYEAYQGNVTPISWQTEAGTVYGGECDVTEGEVAKSLDVITFNGGASEAWVARSGGFMEFTIPNGKLSNNSISNMYPIVQVAGGWASMSVGQLGYTSSNPSTFRVRLEADATLAEWKAFLAENPLQVLYELATPQTYDIDPTPITLLQGDNNVWCDTGEISVTYRADIQKWVEKKL